MMQKGRPLHAEEYLPEMFRELYRRLTTATGDVKHTSGAGSILEVAVLQDVLVEAVWVGGPEEEEE